MSPNHHDPCLLGIRQPSAKEYVSDSLKHTVSPPSGRGNESDIYPRKRKASVLTPDNADVVLSSCFDIRNFMDRLIRNPDIALDEHSLFTVMKECVKDAKVCILCLLDIWDYLGVQFADRQFLECYTSTSQSAWT